MLISVLWFQVSSCPLRPSEINKTFNLSFGPSEIRVPRSSEAGSLSCFRPNNINSFSSSSHIFSTNSLSEPYSAYNPFKNLACSIFSVIKGLGTLVLDLRLLMLGLTMFSVNFHSISIKCFNTPCSSLSYFTVLYHSEVFPFNIICEPKWSFNDSIEGCLSSFDPLDTATIFRNNSFSDFQSSGPTVYGTRIQNLGFFLGYGSPGVVSFWEEFFLESHLQDQIVVKELNI